MDETREASSWGDLWGSGSGRPPVHERELTEDIWAEPPPPVDYEQALEDPKPKSRHRWRRRSR